MKNKENYLEKKPVLKSSIPYSMENNIVTLEIENGGFMNRLAQKFFKKPKTSFIHLDEFGSFAVLCADGKRNIIEIGKMVEEKFGEKANPLYERLAKFFQIMDSYYLLEWKYEKE